MGIFSSKKVTQVDTSVIRISDDNTLPNSVLEGTIKAIFKQTPIVETIKKSLFESKFRNFEKMYRYAQSGGYYYGLPNARVLTSTGAAVEVKAAIEAEIGETITVDYAYFRPINNVHVAYKELTETYGYNHETNELTTLSASIGFPVYLDDIVPVHALATLDDTEKTAVGIWGTSPRKGYTPERKAQTGASGLGSLVSSFATELGGTEEVEIKYVWEEAGEIERDSVVVSLAAFDLDLEYHQVKYHFTGGSGVEYGYWIYAPEDGTYPDVDAVFGMNYTSPGTYFPFAIFRREKVNRADPAYHATDEYLTTKKLLEFINVDFQEFADKVHENPGIADIEQAALIMGVPMNTSAQVEIDYLMRYFIALEAGMSFPPQSISSLSALSAGQDASYAVEIADADFRIIISFDRIEVTLRPGAVAAVGTFTNTLASMGSNPLQLAAPNSVRVFRHQIAAAVYQEVRVHNARTRYDIYAGKSAIGAADDGRLLIPLDYDICRQMSIVDREKLYYRSLHFVANARVTDKVSWYETGVFRALLIIVAIVIAVLYPPAGFKAIATAATVGASAVIIVATQVIISTIINMAIVTLVAQAAVDLLGPEAAAVIAAVALIYGGYKGMQAGGITAGSTAANLLQASSALVSAAQKELGQLFTEFQKDAAAFDTYKSERNALLGEANELLGGKSLLDPFTFVGARPMTLFGESPDDFYNRTIHAGNVGVIGYEIIEKFVGTSLKLPTIDSTFGGST